MGMGLLIEGGGGIGLQFPDGSINGVHIPRRRRSCWVGSKFRDVEVAAASISMLEAANILIAMAKGNGGFCQKNDQIQLEKMPNRKRKITFSHLAPAPAPTPASKKQRKKKMQKIELPNSNPPDMPAAMRDHIVEMGGYEIQLVIQKQLQDTDLNKNHGRLSFPPKQVRVEFTTDEEEKRLSNEGDDCKNMKKGMEVTIMDPAADFTETPICLKKWKIGSGPAYCLMTNWNSFVEKTGLATGDCIQIWSYRRHLFDARTGAVSSPHNLCFAIAKLNIS